MSEGKGWLLCAEGRGERRMQRGRAEGPLHYKGMAGTEEMVRVGKEWD